MNLYHAQRKKSWNEGKEGGNEEKERKEHEKQIEKENITEQKVSGLFAHSSYKVQDIEKAKQVLHHIFVFNFQHLKHHMSIILLHPH